MLAAADKVQVVMELMEGADPGVAVKQLVCQRLPLEDLRSVRLATQDWCRAASDSVSTAVVAANKVCSPVAERVLAAFPCCTHIIIGPVKHGPGDSTSTCSVLPWQQFSTAQQQHCISTSTGSFALLVRDTPHLQPGQGWEPNDWSLVVKAETADDAERWLMPPPPLMCKMVGWLAGGSASIRSSSLARVYGTSLRCLQVDVAMLRTRATPQLPQLPLQCLRQLYLHCSDTFPLRINAQADLKHLGLEDLQLSGNIILEAPHLLNTPHLTSLTLQQMLTSAQLLQLLDKQQRLQSLSVHVVEPQAVQYSTAYSSSCRAVQCLQGQLELRSLQPHSIAAVHFDIAGITLQPMMQATPALVNVLTPPRLTHESIALSFLPQPRRNPPSQRSHAAALHTWALPAAAYGASANVAAAHQCAAARWCCTTKARLERCSHLRQLVVSCGCWVDLQPLLQQVCVEELSIHTLPAVTDPLLRTAVKNDRGMSDDQLAASRVEWEALWRHVGAATLSGAVPGALRLHLPVGCGLSVLVLDTSNTAAGVEIDDKTLLAITSSCPYLQHLSITGLLRFSDRGGPALQRLRELKQLRLCDTRRGAVQHVLALAAVSPRTPSWYIQSATHDLYCHYGVVAACAYLISQLLRQDRLLRIGAQIGLAALMLRPTVEVARDLLPASEVQSARLCTAAVKLAGRAPQFLRPCWLPPGLQLLQLGGCVLRPHRSHCPKCSSHLTNRPQLLVQELSACDDGDLSVSSAGGSPRSHGSCRCNSRHSLRALACKEIRAGRQRRLYPSLFELARRLVLAPAVPLAVTAIASASLRCLWTALLNSRLLRANRQRLLTDHQVHEAVAMFCMGI